MGEKGSVDRTVEAEAIQELFQKAMEVTGENKCPIPLPLEDTLWYSRYVIGRELQTRDIKNKFRKIKSQSINQCNSNARPIGFRTGGDGILWVDSGRVAAWPLARFEFSVLSADQFQSIPRTQFNSAACPPPS